MSKLLAPVLRRGAAAVRKTAATRRYASNVATGADINHLYNGGLLTGVRYPRPLQCGKGGEFGWLAEPALAAASPGVTEPNVAARKGGRGGGWIMRRGRECLRSAACGAPFFCMFPRQIPFLVWTCFPLLGFAGRGPARARHQTNYSHHYTTSANVIVDPCFVVQFRKAYCGPLPPSYTVDEALTKLPPTKVTSLSNGMRVATERTPGES